MKRSVIALLAASFALTSSPVLAGSAPKFTNGSKLPPMQICYPDDTSQIDQSLLYPCWAINPY